ncbi:MAG: EscU/YscU/HrcU family type III secretion system export apparatus switch protein [Pirellulaceae bacterium]
MTEDRDQAFQEPTAARLRRAEQAGQFARSRELATAIMWLGGLAILATLGVALCQWLFTFAHANWSTVGETNGPRDLMQQQWQAVLLIFWRGLFPIVAGIALLALVASWFQNGFRVLPHLAAPDATRLLPQNNVSRMLGIENVTSIVLSMAKFVVLVGIALWIVIGDWQQLLSFGSQPLRAGSVQMGHWLGGVAMRLCLATVITGLADYGIRWMVHRRSLRMTEQEIRDERRSTEPSPEIEARRRLMTRQ